MYKNAVSDKQIDEIYDAIDALMRAGAWNFLNELFVVWEQQAWRLEIDILVTYAVASCPGKSKLPARKNFMDRCMALHPDPDLWKGLE